MRSIHRSLYVMSAVALAALAVPSTASAQLPPSSTTKAPEPERLSPPVPLGNNRLVLTAENADTIYAATISVDVDVSGAPVLSTLVLGGSAGEFNRKAITEWLRKTTFRPAKRNGVPVRGTFRMTAEVLKQADADGTPAPRD